MENKPKYPIETIQLGISYGKALIVKETIRSALIGLVVVFGGYVVVNFVIARLITAVT